MPTLDFILWQQEMDDFIIDQYVAIAELEESEDPM